MYPATIHSERPTVVHCCQHLPTALSIGARIAVQEHDATSLRSNSPGVLCAQALQLVCMLS